MSRRRPINLFNMSFLDCICCGFGAVILLFVIVNARSVAVQHERVADLRGEVSRLEFEVLKGEKNLVQIRNALDESREELVRTEGRARRLLEEIRIIEQELAEYDDTTLATVEHVNKLKADLVSLEEEVNRMKAAVEADQEGARMREFKGTGDRHYLTGLKVGGERILILVDCSSSMLSNRVVDIIRRRNLPVADQLTAPKWRQAVRTVDWLSTQLPPESRFQLIGFNETAFPLVAGTGSTWLDAGDPEDLERAVTALESLVPEKGTSLTLAFDAIRGLPSPPDNIILLTDGLPTVGTRRPRGYKVSPRRRFQLFETATRTLPPGVPVNVILSPMEGDPRAASAFWRLAINTGGSYLCPAEDWP
ncbi:MAG: VWA domain-containing protein [Phycisphaerales bacterium]|nr:VWA domain-containing protein [Phycisphaerae bacterium]NNF42267.1 VWA domain-containing protein [Phycisphaerales bacterium]NNM25765.1 VWA domain-containing protein [Phycisphaerales bacterium]